MIERSKHIPSKTVGEMKITLKELIRLYTLKNHKPCSTFMWGGPGIGKSAIVRQAVEELGMDPEESFIDQRLQQIDPVDLRGLPRINDAGSFEYCPPEFLPTEGRGVLFLDELNLAPQQVQAAAYELVFDRKLGSGYRLPDGWMVIAAGNRSGDRAFVNPMSSPLANRFIHWQVVPDLDDWKEWAYEEGINSDIIGFLNYRHDMLYRFDPERSGHAFPTPRTWERVSDLMELGMDKQEDIASAVGMGAAAEFVAFLNVREELPDVEKILEGEFEVPREPDVLNATISSIIDKAKNRPELAENVVGFANEISDPLAEFSVVMVKDAIKAGIPVQQTSEYKDFVADRGDLIL